MSQEGLRPSSTMREVEDKNETADSRLRSKKEKPARSGGEHSLPYHDEEIVPGGAVKSLPGHRFSAKNTRRPSALWLRHLPEVRTRAWARLTIL